MVVCWRVDLAERRQHVADVAEEGRVRPHHQHALPRQLVAVGVQQERGAVQPDRGLAGAGRALHADRLLQVGADDDVLLGLDGGDDVAHRADPGTLDLGLEDLGVVVVLLLDRRLGQQRLVLVGGHLAVLVAEAPAQVDAHRLGLAGPVERQADPGPPVDDHRVADLVADVPPADVEALAAVVDVAVDGDRGVGVVEPAEEQRHRRVVGQCLHPLHDRGLEVLLADPVAGRGGVEGGGAVTHPGQRGPGCGEVVAFGRQVGVGGHAGTSQVMGGRVTLHRADVRRLLSFADLWPMDGRCAAGPCPSKCGMSLSG